MDNKFLFFKLQKNICICNKNNMPVSKIEYFYSFCENEKTSFLRYSDFKANPSAQSKWPSFFFYGIKKIYKILVAVIFQFGIIFAAPT